MAIQDKSPSNESGVGEKSLTSISPSARNGSHFQMFECLPTILRRSLVVSAA